MPCMIRREGGPSAPHLVPRRAPLSACRPTECQQAIASAVRCPAYAQLALMPLAATAATGRPSLLENMQRQHKPGAQLCS